MYILESVETLMPLLMWLQPAASWSVLVNRFVFDNHPRRATFPSCRDRLYIPPLPDTDHPVSDVHPRSDVASSIDMTLEDIADDRERLRHSQEFHLPPIVRSRVEADIQQAYAFAITTALFAAFLISLAQIVEPLDAKTPAWRALRFFTYSSIVINLSGTTLALVLIKMCSEVQFKAHSMILFDPSSLPARIAKEGIPREILQNRYELLEKFGMPQGYKRLDTGAGFWVLSGNIFTFVSVLMWIWLVGDTVTSSVTTIVILFPICGIIYGIALTKG